MDLRGKERIGYRAWKLRTVLVVPILYGKWRWMMKIGWNIWAIRDVVSQIIRLRWNKFRCDRVVQRARIACWRVVLPAWEVRFVVCGERVYG